MLHFQASICKLLYVLKIVKLNHCSWDLRMTIWIKIDFCHSGSFVLNVLRPKTALLVFQELGFQYANVLLCKFKALDIRGLYSISLDCQEIWPKIPIDTMGLCLISVYPNKAQGFIPRCDPSDSRLRESINVTLPYCNFLNKKLLPKGWSRAAVSTLKCREPCRGCMLVWKVDKIYMVMICHVQQVHGTRTLMCSAGRRRRRGAE